MKNGKKYLPIDLLVFKLIFSLFILFLTTPVFSGEYILWYKIDTKNGIVISDDIMISRVMVPSSSTFVYACSLKNIQNKYNNSQNYNEENFLIEHKYELLDCLKPDYLNVNSYSNSLNGFTEYNIEISSLPLRFMVDFKPPLAIIYRIIK